jgi:hypothetical protein
LANLTYSSKSIMSINFVLTLIRLTRFFQQYDMGKMTKDPSFASAVPFYYRRSAEVC